MSKWSKFRRALLTASSDRNIRFEDLIGYIRHLGFHIRMQGSHHVCTKPDVLTILVLQPQKDGAAKPYQVKQVRQLVQEYKLGAQDDEV